MSSGCQHPIDHLLQPAEVAKILNLSISWLAKARMSGQGPEFVKIGRAVRYPNSSLLKFIELARRGKPPVNEHPSSSIYIHDEYLIHR